MTEQQFIEELAKHNIILTQTQISQFKIYCDYLLEYNKHTNLTAIKDKEQVYLKHFFDSAIIMTKVDLENQKVLDIGTGAGFPGVVLKILCPSIDLTLLDSNNKKTTFLKLLTAKLNIKVNIINDRAENLNQREYFDVIVSRAVAPLRILVELSLPLLKHNGIMISQKSHIETELEEALDTITIVGGGLPKVENITYNEELGQRCIVIIKKEKHTSDIFPRKYDKILKNPLKKNAK